MQHLTFGLIEPFEIGVLQQMIQGTDYTSLSFNRTSSPIFIAHSSAHRIAGFTFGQKGYGDQSHVLIIQGTYLDHQFSDEQYEHELHLAFMNWAEKKLGVTHYKLNEFDTPKPIGINHIIPSQISAPPEEITVPAQTPEYAFH